MESLGIRLDQILFQIINFAVVMYLLKRFVYAPVLKMLDERAKTIQEGQAAAEKNIKLHSQTEEQQAELIANAKKDAKKLIDQAKKDVQVMMAEAQEEAKVKARKALEKEKEAFEAQMKTERENFKQEVGSIVSQATEAVLRGSLDLKIQQKLIDEQISQISATKLQ